MSLACVNIKNFKLSSKMDEDVAAITTIVTPSIVKQGIVSILGSDIERSKAASIRRTLSADMSSKKWLAQNGMLKKIASSDHFPSLIEEDELNRPAQDDVWSSIITQQKNDSSNNLPTPYIHPLVKKSAGSLSEKSLQICTESLGSETGSDGFSSHSPSENGDVDEDKDNNDQQQLQQQQQYNSQSFEEVPVVKYNYSKRSSFPRSFPPPLPSLDREDKTAVHVQSRRQDGRLILEAVSVPPQNHFRAQRHDGRLLLTLINTSPASDQPQLMDDHQVAEFERVFDDIEEIEYNGTPHLDYDNNDGFDGEEEEEDDEDNDDDDEHEDEEEAEQEEKENGTHGIGIVMNHQNPKLTNVNTSALMMKQIIGLEKNKNHQTWSNKFNKAVKLMELEDDLTTPLPQSLPPPHRVSQLITPPPQQPSAAAAASFNPYEYFWRKKPTVASIVNNPTSLGHFNKHFPGMNNNYNNCTTLNANSTTKNAPNDQQDMVLMRGNKGNMNYYLVKGCKEARRTLLIWEPKCIATS